MDMPFSGGLPKFENGGSLTVDTSVFEGLVPGMGGGMDDIVPAIIDGMEPVLLSRDELCCGFQERLFKHVVYF